MDFSAAGFHGVSAPPAASFIIAPQPCLKIPLGTSCFLNMMSIDTCAKDTMGV